MATYTGTTTDENGNAFVTTCEDHEHDDGFEWSAPAGQTGDGATALNKKLGY